MLPLLTMNVWAPANLYSVSVSPSTVNLGQTASITIAITGGAPNVGYTMRTTVTKPSGTGQAYVDVTVATDVSGNGQGGAVYPNNVPAWTVVTPSLGTDATGPYNVSADKLAPNPAQNGVAAATFWVTNRLAVTPVSPAAPNFTRGITVMISGTVHDANGQPVTTATVTANTPRSTITLSPSLSPGSYSSQYQLQKDDSLGTWNITITANSPGGNTGAAFTIVQVLPSPLIVTNLATYNSFGTPTSDFSPGDSLYAEFKIAYSGSGFADTGTYALLVRNPSGATVSTLQAIYDPNRALFYTPSGLQVSSSDPGGSWELAIPSFSMADAYGNTGPTATITFRFQVRTGGSQNQPLSTQFYLIVAALMVGGGLGGTVLLRRFNTTTAPFEDLFKLTGGEVRPPASVMIIGDAGAGATTLGLQLLYRDLNAGKFCALISYDSFPSEIRRRMRDMGWDITPYLERGQLKILDCYSSLAGVEGALIKEPTDFTEVSIQVTGMAGTSKSPPTILLDSVTPMFNSASAKDCINFLQVIGAKVKNSGGMFILTTTKGSIPDEARSKIESLVDGVIELSLIKKARSLVRSLQVKKIAGHHTSPKETEFVILAGKGILLVRQRIPLDLLRFK